MNDRIRVWLVVNLWTGAQVPTLALGPRDALVQIAGWGTGERRADGWMFARDWRVRLEPMGPGEVDRGAVEARLQAAAEVGWHGGL